MPWRSHRPHQHWTKRQLDDLCREAAKAYESGTAWTTFAKDNDISFVTLRAALEDRGYDVGRRGRRRRLEQVSNQIEVIPISVNLRALVQEHRNRIINVLLEGKDVEVRDQVKRLLR